VLDVGCGPREITCELARRHPRLSFVGIDHSEHAIQRANRNAARLTLTNVRFSVGDAEQSYDGPTRLKADAQFRACLDILNAGWDTWRSEGEHPVRVSYHWLARGGEIAEFDGQRSDLPRPVGPGDTCRAFIAVTAPSEPGEYVLAIDLVKEGVTWFSEAGMPWYAVGVHVSGR
jgi:SAM-dependent methyltransferase